MLSRSKLLHLGRESSPGTKGFFNLPVLVLETRCSSGSQPFALVGVPEQALGGLSWVWIDFGRKLHLKFHVNTYTCHCVSVSLHCLMQFPTLMPIFPVSLPPSFPPLFPLILPFFIPLSGRGRGSARGCSPVMQCAERVLVVAILCHLAPNTNILSPLAPNPNWSDST